MADIVLKREPVEEPVLLSATAQPKIEVGIDDDTDSEQSDDAPILMSVKQEMLEQGEEMDHDNEVCVNLYCFFLHSSFIHRYRPTSPLLLLNNTRGVEGATSRFRRKLSTRDTVAKFIHRSE